MYYTNILLLNILLCCVTYGLAEDPIVTLPSGKIRGYVGTTTRNKVPFYAYMGIPFAAPPTGNLRFQPPRPVKPWKDILDATAYDKICYQVGIDSYQETEDCLHLNIFTLTPPDVNATLPVIFNIFGGGFSHGQAIGTYAPQYILEHNVVVVAVNYRVGPFGFLSTLDTVMPGNMGLKDQQFALNWVQKNIHLFGGDPTKVTIMGQSAGGASVTYQILSPGSAGLFRAAIAESGSALCNWAYQRNPIDTAYGVATLINSTFNTNQSSQDLLQVLQSVDAKTIDATAGEYKIYAPVIEIEHEGAFITQSMYETVETGNINRVPLIIGFSSEEQIGKAADLKKLKSTAENYDKNIYLLADEDMNIKDIHNRSRAGEDIRRIYTDGLFQDDLEATIQYMSDNSYVRAVIRYGELQSKYSDVYFYQFSYHGLLGANNVSMDGLGRVAHGEINKYVWSSDNGTDLSLYPESDVRTVDRLITLFTNFAKTLDPTPVKSNLLLNITWPKVTVEEFSFIDINDDVEINQNPREFSYRKWVEIYDEYAWNPHISY